MAASSTSFPPTRRTAMINSPGSFISKLAALPSFSASFSPSKSCRQSLIVVSSSKSSKKDVSSQREREFLERYGLDPREILDDSPSKTKKRKELPRKRGSRKEVSVQESAPPPARTKHRLLQVLGGTVKRKKLLSPAGMDVRPMMEVVKGASFDILQVAGGCPASLRPGRWLDLYSGTGSAGIEALSRGCSEVHFVEMDPWVVSDILLPNLKLTGFVDASTIHTVRVEDFIERSEQFVGKDGIFDYISVTPPYEKVDYAVLMGQISNSSIIGQDSFILVEYPVKTSLLDSCGCLTKIVDRRFGRTHLAIYGPKWAKKRK